jgi:hypothetical protein
MLSKDSATRRRLERAQEKQEKRERDASQSVEEEKEAANEPISVHLASEPSSRRPKIKKKGLVQTNTPSIL